MTYTPEQIAAHIDQRAAAVGENSADVRILRQLVAQVETEREENRWAYINAGFEDATLTATGDTPMTARDQLADRIALILDPDALDPVAQEQARNVADAVIGMVAHLEWEDTCASLDFPCSYNLSGDDEDGWTVSLCYRTCDVGLPEDGFAYPTEEAAKAAANAHHITQWLAALGLDAGEGRG